MIEQPTSIAWSDDDYSNEDEMMDFVVAASEMLEGVGPAATELPTIAPDSSAQAIARVPGGSLAALRVAP